MDMVNLSIKCHCKLWACVEPFFLGKHR